MPNFPPIPRLSIVVPIGRDLAAFECTLISVLENRPSGCEVIVPHNGNYDDPFELCDEVRFVVAESNRVVDAVTAAASSAKGRFVHVLADGIQATGGWTDAALGKFERFDAGAVAPVIRDAGDGTILAAGWYDSRDRLCKNNCQGCREVGGQAFGQIGTHLQASFWRRDLLRSLCKAYKGKQSLATSYAWEFLLRQAGWRCELAGECNLLSDSSILPWDCKSFGRGQQLRAIRNHFCRGGWSSSMASACRAVLANTLRPRMLTESLGQAAAPLADVAFAKRIDPTIVMPCDVDAILKIETPSTGRNRNAA